MSFHFIFQDILKIGGPYGRLTFLNASAVSKEYQKKKRLTFSILELL
jgi:hypothetical protein